MADRNDMRSLSLFQKILLATDGTVTDLIGLYTGERIRVKKLEQSIVRSGAPPLLACAEGMRLLSRRILLSGATKNYLHADSMFVVERMSPAIQTQLLETDQPIGLMWKAARLETFRDVIECTIAPCAEIAGYFDLSPDSLFVSRTYAIYHSGQPIGLITEKWPAEYFRETDLEARAE